MNIDLPILYDYLPPAGTTTQAYWETYGLGVLVDCISCEVREERNGAFEVEITYKSDGALANEIKMGRVIRVPVTDRATHIFQAKKVQPFKIYNISKNLDGKMLIRCEHLTYAFSGMYIHKASSQPNVNADGSVTPRNLTPMQFAGEILGKVYHPNRGNNIEPFQWMIGNSLANVPQLVKWDIEKRSLLSVMLEGEDSFVGTWGGEIVRDEFTITQYESISSQAPEEWYRIDYGSNLLSLDLRYSFDDVATHLVPYAKVSVPTNIEHKRFDEGNGALEYIPKDEWSYQDVDFYATSTSVTLLDTDGKPMHEKYGFIKVAPVDLSNRTDFLQTLWIGKGAGTAVNTRYDIVRNELLHSAKNFAFFNKPQMVSLECTVDFITLWNTEEYKTLGGIDYLRLGDYAKVYHPDLSFAVETKVVGTTYDVLKKRFTKLELSSNFPGNDNKIRVPDL